MLFNGTPIRSDVKEFLLKYLDLIDEFNIDALYLLMETTVDAFFPIEQVTQCLWEIDIDPLKYLDRVPYCYCYENKTIEEIIIPGRCKVIDTFAFYDCRKLKKGYNLKSWQSARWNVHR